MLILNIGDCRNVPGDQVTLTEAIDTIQWFLQEPVTAAAIVPGDDENTIVLELRDGDAIPPPDLVLGLHAACSRLQQDCIAISRDPDGCTGALIGPRSDKWAPFNPDFFTTIPPEEDHHAEENTAIHP